MLRAGGEQAHLKPEHKCEAASCSASWLAWVVRAALSPTLDERSAQMFVVSWITACCPGGRGKGVSLRENFTLREGGENFPLHFLNPQAALCQA